MNNLIIVSPDLNCNNNCIMCQNGFREEDSRFTNPKQFIECFDRKYSELETDCRIAISGGEPTIFPGVLDVISKIKERGFSKISLFTNGRRLSDIRFVKALISSGIDHFHVALHAADEMTNTQIVRVEEAYQETISGLRNVSELKGTYEFITLSIVHVLQEPNYRLVREFVDFIAENFVVDYLLLSNCIVESNVFDQKKDLIVSHDALRKHLVPALAMLRDKKISFFIENLPPCVFVGFESHYFDLHKKQVDVNGFAMKTTSDKVRKSIDKYHKLSSSSEFTYSTKCDICVYRKICTGLFATYLKKFKEDTITPVTYQEAMMSLVNNRILNTKSCL